MAHSYLALMFGWSAYLYLESSTATIFFWEGEFLDMWFSANKIGSELQEIIKVFGLRITANHRSPEQS
jgi:hypothetical protein